MWEERCVRESEEGMGRREMRGLKEEGESTRCSLRIKLHRGASLEHVHPLLRALIPFMVQFAVLFGDAPGVGSASRVTRKRCVATRKLIKKMEVFIRHVLRGASGMLGVHAQLMPGRYRNR
jgi:hypothetical protein